MDLQFKSPEGRFKCRVVGIYNKEGKVLLSKLKNDDYWALVGGKAEFGESTGDAVLREFQEELGVRLELDRLLAVIENFFIPRGENNHEFLFIYLLSDPENQLVPVEGEHLILDHPNAVYRWFPLDELDKIPIKPVCTKAILMSIPDQLQHIVNRDQNHTV